MNMQSTCSSSTSIVRMISRYMYLIDCTTVTVQCCIQVLVLWQVLGHFASGFVPIKIFSTDVVGRVTCSVLVQMIDSSFYNSMSFYVNAVLEIIRGFLAKRVYIAFWVDFLFSQDQHIFGRLNCLDTKSFIL